MMDVLVKAQKYLGLSEIRDRSVLRIFLGIDPKTTPWCAAFVNAVLKEAGIKGTGSNLARSFLRWGVPVEGTPELGDIIVFKRGNSSWQGHVGFVCGVDSNDDTRITVLGGNQSDKVCKARYDTDHCLGIRREDV